MPTGTLITTRRYSDCRQLRHASQKPAGDMNYTHPHRSPHSSLFINEKFAILTEADAPVRVCHGNCMHTRFHIQQKRTMVSVVRADET